MAENRTKKEQKAAVSEKQKRRLPDGGGGIGARCVTGMGVARCCRNVVMCRSDSKRGNVPFGFAVLCLPKNCEIFRSAGRPPAFFAQPCFLRWEQRFTRPENSET